MGIRRVVPDHTSDDLLRSRAFYGDFLGFKVGMDMGWIVNFVAPDNPAAQVIVMTEDQTADVSPDLTIEVDDVDRLHARALECGYDIVHPLTDEPWGVRRFFVRDPGGKVVNVMSHLARRKEPATT
jgi:catechol 2,3-dioxygenase-like lactoylglutathione lyase family enzyme